MIGASFWRVASGTASGRVMMAVASAWPQPQVRGTPERAATAPAITCCAVRAFCVQVVRSPSPP